VAGQREKSQQSSQLPSRRPPIRNFQKAIVFSGLQKRKQTLEALAAAYEEGDPWFSYFSWMTDPFFASIRTEPQFAELMRRMKIPG